MHDGTSNPTRPNLYKGIVFDLDGTLLNTLHCIATAFNSALEQLDFPTHQSTDFRAFIGDGVFKCAERALPMEARNEATITELVALEREIYEATWMQEISVYDGIGALLDQLRASNIATAVLTNKDQGAAESCLTHCFPDHRFEQILGFSGRYPHKPNPVGGQALIRDIGLPSHSLAMIGDTEVDIQTALACGMLAVGVSWGFRDRADLEAAGCDLLIDHPSEILKLTY
jgi:phosphoglycolate phosphatase